MYSVQSETNIFANFLPLSGLIGLPWVYYNKERTLNCAFPQTAAQAASGTPYRIVFALGICVDGILLLESGDISSVPLTGECQFFAGALDREWRFSMAGVDLADNLYFARKGVAGHGSG
jgi:hypothetical protein